MHHLDVSIHPSACLDEPVSIGPGTRIWHFCHVMRGARIGRACVLGQNVFVASEVTIGDRVRIQNNVSVYSGVELESDVFCGPSCVFTNVSHPRAEFSQKGQYERTLVRRGATIGANATVVCGVTIGRHAFVGAGAVVTRDVPDYVLVTGVPAERTGYVGRHGKPLERTPDGLWLCPASGFRYQESAGVLRCLDLDEESPLPR
jgi:UDP-2-acetamido-3-amino-2,3-dideoxy-glucuronate N-acetyltransferase